MWGVWCRALSHLDCPPTGRAAGAHYPLAVGAGGCGRGDPSQTPQRALLRGGFARCGGGMRVPRGAPLAWVWGVWGRALSHPRLPALWAGCRGPLPAGCGCGGVRAWGPVTNPTARALSSWPCALGGRHEGARGGAPPAWVWGVRGQELSHPRLPALWAGCRGPLPTGCRCGGVRAWGPVTNPTARALASWLCALWGGMRVPGGAPPAWASGVRGRALSRPRLPALWAGCRGPLPTGCGCRGGRAWRPVANPTARALSSWLCTLVGRHEGARGGAPPAWVWGVRGRALSHPRLPALWAGRRGPLPTGCGCGGMQAWGPVTNPTARAFSSWLCALWGRHEGARGGAPPAWVWGVRGRALSHPRLPALWAGCRSPLPTGCGCGGARAWGPVTNPTARALASWLCALWGRHEGARGGRLLPGSGASGVGRSLTPDCPPFGQAAGLLCVCVPCLAGSGRLPSWGRFGAPHLSLGLSCFAPCLFRPLRAGVALFVVVVGFFFLFVAFPLLPLAAPPLCRALLFFRPRVSWALVSCCPPPVPFFCFFCPPPPPSLLSQAFLAFWLPLASAPPPLLFFFLLVLLLFFLLRARCVCSGVSCCVFPVLPIRCAVRVVCAVSGGWCCWFRVSLPFVGGLLVVLVARRCHLAVCVGSGARVSSGRRWASSLWCPVPLCCVLSRCAAVWCCAVVPCFLFFFVFLPPPGAGFLLFCVVSGLRACSGSFLFLCSACAVLCWCACAVALCSVLSCPRGAGWCFVLLPVVFVCLLLGLAVLCCLLVGPGGSWCRVSVACCGVSLGAVLRRVAARCAAWRCVVVRCAVSFCSVWCCRALCCVLGRCPSSWGPVPSGAVFCLVPPRCVCFAVVCRCVVLFAVVHCAVCALGCRVVRFLSSPPCAVLLCRPLSLGALLPCAVPRGAVLPRGAVVSCPAALLGLFLAWVWLYLLEKPLQNFVKYFFPLFLAFENKIKIYTTQHTRVQQDHVRCCALHATRRS